MLMNNRTGQNAPILQKNKKKKPIFSRAADGARKNE